MYLRAIWIVGFWISWIVTCSISLIPSNRSYHIVWGTCSHMTYYINWFWLRWWVWVTLYRISPDSHTRRYRSELCFMRIARTIIYLVIGDLIHGHIHTIMHYHYARVLILSRVIALSPLMLWNLFEDTQHILYPTCVQSLSRMITIVGVKYMLCTSPMYLYVWSSINTCYIHSVRSCARLSLATGAKVIIAINVCPIHTAMLIKGY